MFLNKIFHFVKGYVIIRVSGNRIERFLYICAKQGIKLFHLGKRTEQGVAVCIGISDFFRIRKIRRKTNTKIRILKKYGLPFYIKKLKRRYALLSGLVLLILLVFVSSNFIWSVEICENSDDEVVLAVSEAVKKAGIFIGAFKPSLMDGNDIKNVIINNTDNIVWAWVYIKGSKAVVEYKVGVLPPKMVDKSIPCDIVAIRDGLIVSITEKNGVGQVLEKSTVKKGDILIAGTKQMPDSSYKTVHAIGEVRAYTEHRASKEYKLYKKEAKPTGRKKEFITLKLFSKCFDLFLDDLVDFSDYKVTQKLSELKIGEDQYLGVGIYKKTYDEIEYKNIAVSYEDAVESARNELEEEIANNLTPGARLTDKTVEDIMIDDETVKVTVIMQFIEEIGCEVPIR